VLGLICMAIGSGYIPCLSERSSKTRRRSRQIESIRAQDDLFAKQVTNNYNPCPYNFKYRYRTDDGPREGTCQDWEIEATYHNWSGEYGEQRALADMERVFGREYPAKGMLLAMGTHSLHQDTWLINGVVRQDGHQPRIDVLTFYVPRISWRSTRYRRADVQSSVALGSVKRFRRSADTTRTAVPRKPFPEPVKTS
jgi:hypothetical protein